MIIVAADFLHAELRQVFVHELGVQQLISPLPQPRDQIYQRDLAGIGCGRKHAFTEKSAADGNAIDAAHQLVAAPRLDAMRETCFVKLRIQINNLVIDPCIGARVGAARHDGAEGAIEGDAVRGLPYRALQPFRHMQPVDGQNAAQLRVIPFDRTRAAAARHRKHADGIGMQQQLRRDGGITLGQGSSQA